MTNTISSRLLTPIMMYLNRKGIPLELFYSKAGLSAEQNIQTRISVNQLNECYSIARELSSDDHAGLHIGQFSSLAYYGITGQILVNSQSINDMFENYFKYHPILCDTLRFSIEKTETSFKILLNLNKNFTCNEGFTDSLLSTIVTNMEFITGKKIKVESVHLMHNSPKNTNEYERIFGILPQFNQSENSISLPGNVLQYEILFNDKKLLQSYKIEADIELAVMSKKNLSDQIHSIIYMNHLKGFPTLKDLSVLLGMSYRTIQELLRLEGNSYSKICSKLKLELSKKYLARGMTVSEVSSLLHFSEPSAFSHFFKRNTSRTPGNFK